MSEQTPTSPAPPAARTLSLGNKLARGLWGVAYLLLFRPTPRICRGWRRMLLRLFGAKIGPGALVYPSTRIWAPWNLRMEAGSKLGPDVDCYCVAPITLGQNATVSQYSYLCSASRDFHKRSMPLIAAPIVIEKDAWVCADVFVGMGVTVGEGAVVGARSSVYKDVPPWTVVGGNPAKVLGKREMVD